MTSLLILVIVALLGIAIWQLTKIFDLTQGVSGNHNNANSEIATDKDNNISATEKIVVIDAGHGGRDPGTSGTLNDEELYEKTVNLEIAQKVKKLLEKQKEGRT